MKAEKVYIEIEGGQHYDKSVKGGAEYTSVGFSGRGYGSGSPCDNKEAIKRAVKSCEEWVLKEGDIPIIRDLRIKQQTLF